MSAPQKTPDKPLVPRHAWQPFTPRGVAAFALATLTRLILVQLIIATIVAVALVWFLRVAWVPVITEAIQQLPDTGAIRHGELKFNGESPARLAGNSRLGMVVDLAGSRGTGQVADLEMTFEKNRVGVRGPLGDWWQPYDHNYIISFNRTQLGPAWGAWRWPILAAVALGTIASLLVLWWGVALLYLPLVKLIAFCADRTVTWRGAWRLSAAALLGGACLVAAGLVLYGFGAIDFFRLGLVYLLHALSGLVFVVTSPFFLPKLSPVVPKKNPFDGSAESKSPAPAPKPSSRFANPDR